jgi:hypothetical protein
MNFQNDIELRSARQALERGLLRREADKRGLEGLLALAHKNLTHSRACRDRLRALKVPDRVIDSGLVGMMRAFFDGRPDALRWTPDVCAAPCVIVGIRDDGATARVIDHPHPEWVTLHGTLIDLVAFRTDSPGVWAQYNHVATIAGRALPQYTEAPAVVPHGAEAWEVAAWKKLPQLPAPPPTLVSRHPLAWLAVAFDGISILTRQRNEIRDVVLRLHGGIVTNGDEAYARTLRAIADRPWPHPRISAHWEK